MDKGKGAGGERWEGRGVRERGKVGGREKLLVGRHRNPNRNRTAKIKRKNRNTKTAKGDKGSISPTDWSFVAGLKHPVKNDQPGCPRRKGSEIRSSNLPPLRTFPPDHRGVIRFFVQLLNKNTEHVPSLDGSSSASLEFSPLFSLR